MGGLSREFTLSSLGLLSTPSSEKVSVRLRVAVLASVQTRAMKGIHRRQLGQAVRDSASIGSWRRTRLGYMHATTYSPD